MACRQIPATYRAASLVCEDCRFVYTSPCGDKKIIPMPQAAKEPTQTRLENCANCGAGRSTIQCDYCGTRT